VHPGRYAGIAEDESMLLDEQRDATALALVRAALAAGTPLFCICRGFQELNVALGGTLHQELHGLEGRLRHHERNEDPLEVQYGPAHEVRVTPGGLLHRLAGAERFAVNSLHRQGIDRLAARLLPEAWAQDGTVEAVSVEDARAFALGVQWHPEWKVTENPVSLRLFRAFGDAMRANAARERPSEDLWTRKC
jgi:putative glutamine amidotransferase